MDSCLRWVRPLLAGRAAYGTTRTQSLVGVVDGDAAPPDGALHHGTPARRRAQGPHQVALDAEANGARSSSEAVDEGGQLLASAGTGRVVGGGRRPWHFKRWATGPAVSRIGRNGLGLRDIRGSALWERATSATHGRFNAPAEHCSFPPFPPQAQRPQIDHRVDRPSTAGVAPLCSLNLKSNRGP